MIVAGCAPSLPLTGAIRGQLDLTSRAAGATAPTPPSYARAAPRAETPIDAVVYLERLQAAAQDEATKPKHGRRAKAAARSAGSRSAAPDATARAVPTIVQLDHRFEPRVLPVASGTTVRFENHDRIYHNVFSVSPAKRFDVGKYAPRQARHVVFERAGAVQLFSDIDPAMAGFVYVVPHRPFTQPDARGGFLLPELSPGSYRVRVWHPTRGETSRKIDVAPGAEAVVRLRL